MEVLLRNSGIFLFYIFVVLLIFINRKKFEFQGKIIALYRTKVGIRLMKRMAGWSPEFWKLLGYIGIGLGFIGMVVMSYLLISMVPNIITSPEPIEGVAPVLPGVKIPWSSFHLPLLEGLLAIFIVATIHEFSHGLIAKAHKVTIKNTGIAFFGPIFGAFVEPDEEQLEKKSDVVQYSIYAAGPMSNVVLAILVSIFMGFVLSPALVSMSTSTGFSLGVIIPDQPAYNASLPVGVTFVSFNGMETKNATAFLSRLPEVTPGQELIFVDESGSSYVFNAGTNPDDPTRGYIGIRLTDSIGRPAIKDERNPKQGFSIPFRAFSWLYELSFLIQLLSLGIGLANLLPLGPLDGGRMVKVAFEKIFGTKKGEYWWKVVSLSLLFVLVLNLILPAIRWAFTLV